MSNIERSTLEIKLEDGTKLVYWDRLTQGDKRAIGGVYMKQVQMSQKRDNENKTSQTEMHGVSGVVAYDMQDAAFKVIIQKVIKKDGKEITDKAEILNFVMNEIYQIGRAHV